MADRPLASPLSLLLESDDAHEVLALTFTFNGAFWEQFALSAARSLHARVTVVSDATAATIDPRAVRKAGVSYLDGRAACRKRGAFHPKVLVIAAPEHATVAIGSGNLTLSGWHENAEIWTVLRGTRDSAPDTFNDLAKWLTSLPAEVAFSAGVEEALGRTSNLLAGLEASEPGPKVVSSLSGPIIDQLPTGPTEDLVISSPFLDRNTKAVTALIERFSPSQWHLILDQAAVFDGQSVVATAEKSGGELLQIESDRYHHGKLVEWERDGARFGLTGSPNASMRGLVLGMGQGGNCEVGLVAEIPESIRPATTDTSSIDLIRSTTYRESPHRSPGITLLGATIEPDGLHLVLVDPLEQEANLQVADGDIWLESSALPAGQNPVLVEVPLQAGTLLRLQYGSEDFSNIVAATSLSLTQRRSLQSTGQSRTDQSDMFQDPRAAEAFARDLLDLRTHLTEARAPGPRVEREPSGPREQRFETWEEYLDHLAAHLGEAAVRYGLALPNLGSLNHEWVETEFDPDDPDDPEAESGTTEHDVPDLGDRSQEFKKRFRRWANRLVDAMPSLLPSAQLIAARLLLRSRVTGLWDDHDECHPLIVSAARSLSASEPLFPEEAPRLASMVAICLSAVRRDINLRATGEKELQYQAAVEASRDLLKLADETLVQTYAAEFVDHLGESAQATRILDVASHLTDPLGEIALDLSDLGHRAIRDGQGVRILPWEAHPLDTALMATARAHRFRRLTITYSDDDQVCRVAWVDEELLIEEEEGGVFNGRLLRLGRLIEPADLRQMDPYQLRQMITARWDYPGTRPPEARALLKSRHHSGDGPTGDTGSPDVESYGTRDPSSA